MLGWFKKKLGRGKAKEEKVELPVEEERSVELPEEELLEETAVADPAVEPMTEKERVGDVVEPVPEPVPEPEPESESEPQTPAEPDQEPDPEPELEQQTEPVSTEAPSLQATEEPKKKGGLFTRLKERLSKTRDSLVTRLDSVFLGRKVIDDDLLDEIEEVLITADLGVGTVQDLLDETRRQVKRKELSDPEVLYRVMREKIYTYLHEADKPAELVMPDNGPFVIMVLGVNGVGKTTTIGKLAYKFKQSGQSVLLVAADTFRAAAIEQLKIWADRIGVGFSAQKPGADPSSVVFDALESAKNRHYDVIIVDTAGRLHTKVNLMEELKKIKRVMDKKCSGAPHEVLLVLDATTGQNAISQARLFNQAVDVSGLALTKLDGTAKGGIVVNISREFKIPIRFIGIGESMEDLRDFDPKEFIEALFAR